VVIDDSWVYFLPGIGTSRGRLGTSPGHRGGSAREAMSLRVARGTAGPRTPWAATSVASNSAKFVDEFRQIVRLSERWSVPESPIGSASAIYAPFVLLWVSNEMR
jgi:hypothetical protein